MKYDEQKVIELGKIWMKNSINPTHNFEHATTVEKHAINIIKEYPEIDENLVKMCVWWHDCYKSRLKKDNLSSRFVEGRESAYIFEREVGNLIPTKRKKEIVQAIKFHNVFPKYLFFKNRINRLGIILYEADQLERYNKERFQKDLMNIPSIAVPLFISLEWFLRIVLSIVAESKYTKKLIYKYQSK